MDKLGELKRLAECATEGPWKVGYNDGSGKYDDEKETFALTDANDECVLHARLCDTIWNAAFIAAANPQTVLALIQALEAALEAATEVLEAFAGCGCDRTDAMRNALSTIQALLDGKEPTK